MKIKTRNKIQSCNKEFFKKSIYYSLQILFVIIILVLNSCSNYPANQCLKDYFVKTTNSKRPPSLIIVKETKNKKNSGCEYIITIECSIFNRDYFPNTIFYKKNRKFFIQFNEPKTKPTILFDLSSEVGKEEKLVIETINNHKNTEKEIFPIILEKKLNCDGEPVYLFRIKGFYRYYEELYDIVYFVTDKAGVIGSYISTFDQEGKEIYIAPGGNICREQIDYSKKEEGVFR